ncbi:DUF3784 domain-containing protein [Bacillus thuringiensis]|uniref:DUF3784 domain-containing protein n=1 Tax=Bacillus thuringiensis TaxID=1428 RepID=UPI000BECF520|nr:DUF3784 domain-containing protein [Bacillus thuringiensis]PDY26980.1 exonuclease [Bacillus thuringiensis]PGH92606.1 exonuclease [Bacillus thuringiensis]
MDYKVMVLGLVFLALSYVVGIKKQTHFLTGFNQHRVRDKQKLGVIVGSYSFAVAVVLIVSGFIEIVSLQILMPLVVVGYLILAFYVNMRMVE